MSSRIHQATSAVPEIDSVIASTSRTPFIEELTEVKLRKMDKLRLPEYKPGGDPVEHLTAFNIAVARARLAPDERDAGYCQLFIETLNEQALTWFSGLEENSIRSFKELSSAFLKTYIMFTKREATASTLWNLKQTKDQNLRDYMERFKSVVSRINIPDHIAVDALRNNLLVECKFREDLYRCTATTLQDAVARSHNFIRMEEDTKAILSKHNSAKPSALKNAATAHVEPRQHAPSDKNNRKNGLLYVVDENGKKWNTFHRETDPPSESPRATVPATVAQVDSAAGSSRTPPGLTKSCKLHGVKGHDTSECKTLFAQFLSSLESGEIKIPPPKPKSENSWSRNKDRKNQRKNQAKPRQDDQKPKVAEQIPHQDDDDEESDLEEALDPLDLRVLLKRKTTSTNDKTPGSSDLRVELNAKRTKHSLSPGSSLATTDGNPIVDLRDQLNARVSDLRAKLDHKKAGSPKESEDLRALLTRKQSSVRPRINVIMGGSPPCGDSVRAVKDHRRMVDTSQRWPQKFPTDLPISFSTEDLVGVNFPHNDPLLVVLAIDKYDVTKVLIDTGSSVDIIFRETLVKIGIDLKDVKPSSRTLTGFNGSSEVIMGTIRLSVQAEGVARMVKFSVVSTKAPYHGILGTPWLYSMRAIASTYHQCVRFPGMDGTIKTVRGDQRAARDLLIATVKLQRSQSLVNSISPPISKICPQKEEVLEVPVDESDPSKVLRVGAYLSDEMQRDITDFLKQNLSTFAWSMTDIRESTIVEEVERLLSAGSIAEVRYPEWLANPVVVKKKNGKWRMCVDFTDLNKACPKDSYPLPNIDRLVESTAGNEMLTFMDAFSGYNQIMMHPDDREKTSFITDRGTYCYKVMPFGLKNAGATYQRLVNRMFAKQLGTTMEVYIDDMLVKSVRADDHLAHLRECFDILNAYKMKLNPAKCTFGVSSGEFLGYIVTQRGIEANPKQISAVLDLPSPRNCREVQRLTGRIAALNRFISRSTDKCLPFYDLLRGNKKFIWDDKCEEAFNQLKHYLTTPPILAKPDIGDVLSLYIAVSSAAVRSVLIKEDRGEQRPVFYMSRRMTGPETRYPTLEKMALAVVESARKLRPYFQSHSVEVLTDQPLRTVLQNTNRAGRLTKWAIELGELDITYKCRTAAKAQVLADFLVELSPELAQDLETSDPTWILHVDASNNEAEYESLIAGLRLAKAVKAKRLSAYCDSQLVASQFSGDYDARNDRMDAYLRVVQSLAKEFEFFELTKVPRGENVCADALAALGSKLCDQVKRTIPIHRIEKPSIDISTESANFVTTESETTSLSETNDDSEMTDQDQLIPDWRTEFIQYLTKGTLPTDKWAARRLKRRSAHYVVMEEELHRVTANKVLLKCIFAEQTQLVMAETHEGAGGNHSGGRSLALKIRNLGFFWPTMNTDCEAYARRCDKCQRHAPSIHSPTELLRTSAAPYPFMRWGMDIIGPMPNSRQRRFVLVLTEYFTKWIEAEAFAQVTEKEVRGFVWKNIICRHGLPYEIVTDNGSQFMAGNFKDFCNKWNIRLSPSTPRYPQGNGQAESSNKIIIDGIKKRLDLKKGHWADELDGVLWSHRTTPRGATKSTPFSLAYGMEAMAPAEVNVTSLRRSKMPQHVELNQEMLLDALDGLEEKRDQALLRIQNYQNKIESYYNKKVRSRPLELGDLVIRKVFENTKEPNAGKLGANWEGPYKITRVVKPGVYRLETSRGEAIPRAWNSMHLRRFYS
ncbi:uncharacterized protein LOC117129318 [Brassica rapa]|uniref:uncharacterized protein LOC117129318 n=1 Tax=Brassica campestris TaxID=3711 RepID=UPI00142D7F2F|nr:uncharacterized protein LOC117129318 [Brassica rapa]